MTNQIIATFTGRWKLFLATLIAQFAIAFMLHLGVRLPEIFNFLVLTGPKTNASLASPFGDRLKEKSNSFFLKKPVSLMSSVYASADFTQAKAYVTVDSDSGQILDGRNEETRVPIASLTKIMTALIGLDLAPADQQFTVRGDAARVEPTSIGVVEGQKMSLDELLHAALMTSANDGVQVIKDGIDEQYGAGTFVRAMNDKAQFLGLKNTHFQNPQGFDNPGNYSTADDLAVLTHYALTNYPEIADIVKTDYRFLPADGNHKQFDLYNWNGLLGVYPGVEGMKIGNTDDAGYTTVVVARRDGHKLITVVLGAPGVVERDMWAAQALDEGFAKYGLNPVNVTEAQLKAKYATWKYWG